MKRVKRFCLLGALVWICLAVAKAGDAPSACALRALSAAFLRVLGALRFCDYALAGKPQRPPKKLSQSANIPEMAAPAQPEVQLARALQEWWKDGMARNGFLPTVRAFSVYRS